MTRKQNRMALIGGVFAIAALAVGLTLTALGRSVAYFYTPSDLAALAGFAVASAGIALPGPARSFFDILGRAAGPAALFSLGLFLAARRAAILPYAPNIAAIASFKMALLPALSLALLHFLGVDDPHYRGALALFTVVPTAVSAFIMASQYGRYVEQSAAAIAVTTALSLASISAVLILFA